MDHAAIFRHVQKKRHAPYCMRTLYHVRCAAMSLRRNLAPGFLRQAQKPECAGIMSAMRPLYHVRSAAMVPPADFSAWLSAVNAETRMRRYHARFAVIISCPLRGGNLKSAATPARKQKSGTNFSRAWQTPPHSSKSRFPAPQTCPRLIPYHSSCTYIRDISSSPSPCTMQRNSQPYRS